MVAAVDARRAARRRPRPGRRRAGGRRRARSSGDALPLLGVGGLAGEARGRAPRWPAPSTLTPKRPDSRDRAQRARAAVEAGEHQRRVERERGDGVGRRARPGPSAPSAVTTVTPVGTPPSRCGSPLIGAGQGRRGYGGHRCGGVWKYDAAACVALTVDSSPSSPPRSPSLPAAARASTCPRTTRSYEGAELFAERCSGCHTLNAGRHPGLREPRAARPGPEPRPAHRDLRRRPLRDPQRRVLRRDHAPEHRRRRRRGGGRQLPRRVLRLAKSRSRPSRGAVDAAESIAGARQRRSPARPAGRSARTRSPARARARPPRARPTPLDELLALDARRRELLPRSRSRRAEQNKASDAIAEAKRAGEDADEAIARDARGLGRDQGARGRAGRGRGGARRARGARCRTCPTPDAPDGETDEDAVVAPRGRRAARVRLRGRATTSSSASATAGSRWRRPPRPPARASPTCSATWCWSSWRWSASRSRPLARGGVHAGRAAGARPRGGALRHGLLPRRARDDLRGPAATSCSWSAPPRSRWRPCTPDEILDAGELPLPLRRHLDLLPPRGRRRRQGHARDLPRPPVRQGRDVLVRRARRSPRPSTSACSRSRSGSSSALEIPYRVVDIPVGDLGAPAARKFDCEAWIPSQERYRELTSCSNTTDYQARRLDCRFRPGAEAPARARPHAERHRGRRRPDADRADRERPAGRRPASACPARSSTAGAPAPIGGALAALARPRPSGPGSSEQELMQ